MYEQFFGLTQRPFSAVPHPDDFVALPTFQEALDSLINCVSQARGIGVITSAPGMGKSLICKKLAGLLQQDFLTIYLSTGAFQTRRALLQAILFELGISYVGLSEQEARLQLIERARQAGAAGGGMLLIVDEAHLLNLRLFEELRTLTDYAPEGESLIRLVLCGQFELEEKLADPALSALNQRIGAHVCLDPLTFEQSARFLSQRLFECGATDLSSLVTDAGLEMICRASDGNLRCLSQLADHSFLLAFADEARPVTANIVRLALDDLKELPLQWNDSMLASIAEPGEPSVAEDPLPDDEPALPAPAVMMVDPSQLETDEFVIPDFLRHPADHEPSPDPEPEKECVGGTLPFHHQGETGEEDEVEYAVIEVGSGMDAEAASEESETTVASAALPEIMDESREAETDMIEAPVIDRYATLDRIFELPEDRRDSVQVPTFEQELAAEQALPRYESATATCIQQCEIPEQELLETVRQLRQEVQQLSSWSQVDDQEETIPDYEETYRLYDIVGPSGAVYQREFTEQERPLPQAEVTRSEEALPRRYEQLFTRLRQRRRRIEAEKRGE
ncbi:ExeA family protein [Planctomicrobium sp. SH664]|uniref:ExeA family protein n=1 Tax=Planctomicrobium sp. SH664 TaxID=3448125 RepID=UPI003F5BB4D8